MESQCVREALKLGLHSVMQRSMVGIPSDTFPLLLPVVMELKNYRAKTLLGLLPCFLESLGMSIDAVNAIRTQPHDRPKVRLVLLCDGIDELQGDVSSLEDLAATLCGGPGLKWSPSVLTVIATSRERAFSSTKLLVTSDRLSVVTLLPFSRLQVRKTVWYCSAVGDVAIDNVGMVGDLRRRCWHALRSSFLEIVSIAPVELLPAPALSLGPQSTRMFSSMMQLS